VYWQGGLINQYINDPNTIALKGRQLLIEARELAKTLDLNGYRRY